MPNPKDAPKKDPANKVAPRKVRRLTGTLSRVSHSGRHLPPEYKHLEGLQVRWEHLLGMSPEVAGIIMGVSAADAETKLALAGVRVSRAERHRETVSNFERCNIPRDKGQTTPLYRMIRNGFARTDESQNHHTEFERSGYQVR